MTTHTHYLNFIVLLATMSPASVGSSLMYLGVGDQNDSIITNIRLFFLLLPLVLLIVLVYPFYEDAFVIEIPSLFFILISIPVAILALFSEYAYNLIYIFLLKRKIYKGIKLSSPWQENNISLLFVGLILSIAIGEEIIYRQLWFYILGSKFSLSILPVIIITSFFYGINHFYFGINIVVSKFISGIIYGSFFFVSGYSVIVSIIIHCIHNLILLILSRKKHEA